jgi:hypothetical protein
LAASKSAAISVNASVREAAAKTVSGRDSSRAGSVLGEEAAGVHPAENQERERIRAKRRFISTP